MTSFFCSLYIKITSTTLLLVVCLSLPAQNGLNANAGIRGLAMGNASVIFQDINTMFSNQAGLATIKNPELIAFSEQRFLLNEISTVGAGVAYPTKSGVFGLQIQYYGFEDYNEQKAGLAYARKLMENLFVGAQVNYINFSIPEYGNKGFLSFEVGLQANIFSDFRLGFHLSNPIGQEIVEDDNLPTVFKLGAAYCPSDKVLLSFEAEKDIDFDTRLKGGIEYQVVSAFALRLGFASNPSTLSFGAGYLIKEKINIDVGTSYHQILGFTPGIALSYQL